MAINIEAQKLSQNALARGLEFHRAGNLGKAKEFYLIALKHDKNRLDALNFLAGVELQSGNFKDAIKLFSKIITLNSKIPQFYLYRGDAYMAVGKIRDAICDYECAIRLNPNYIEAYNNIGNAHSKNSEFEKALGYFDRALEINHAIAEVHNNRANVLIKLERFDEALSSFSEAIRINPKFAEAFNNQGNMYFALRRLDDALKNYETALSLKFEYPEAHLNRGRIFIETSQFSEAFECLEKAISYKPDYSEAYQYMGLIFSETKQFDKALEAYEFALLIDPDLNFISGTILSEKMKMCLWVNFDIDLADLESGIKSDKNVISPFSALTLFDCPDLQLRAAKSWITEKYPCNPREDLSHSGLINDKIKIGYYSSDFYNHATSILIAELFELHDRNRFEVFGFSINRNSDDEVHKRVTSSFDRFIDVSAMSDPEVAKLSREIGIEIAIDLNGFTKHARTEIFAKRCAPIQVNYLGYPSTMGASYIDYIIADKTLIPLGIKKFYSEKIVFLPYSYQVNDRKRRISDRLFTRQELGLPEQGFVFCCFNNSHKIQPATFDSWVRILNAVEDSVLWLLEDNEFASENLRSEARTRGLDDRRLIFSGRMQLDEHLARHRCADLFLDTLPYNAHTTASDALWAGLPVLTCMGQSFAARVAASLLNAIGLPELITNSMEEYEKIAIRLATDQTELKRIQKKLSANRLSTPLFDTEAYTRHLEEAFLRMSQQFRKGLPPAEIEINSL